MKSIRWTAAAVLGLGLALALPTTASARPTRGPRIEVAFVLDATGSMSPWIEQARRRIAAIATDLATGEPAPEIRFGLVAYRDTTDDFVTRVDDLSPDLDAIKARLDETQAKGGGDYPEAVLEALDAAVVQLGWTLDDPDVVKLVYLVGDAPPNHHPTTPDEERVLAEALDRGIVIHTIACGNISDGGEGFFERVARMSEGRPFRLKDVGPEERSAEAVAVTAAGATRTASLAAAVSGSARAYSGSVG
ncbi:MAG: VWA domain-containing protein, partial [Deltaproteobacteria bacterium]